MRFVVQLMAIVCCAYALGFFLAVPANPEVRFWHKVVEERDREIKEIRRSNPRLPILFFTGGSSTAFSMDPKPIEEACGVPAFNLGLPVAAGAEYLVRQALDRMESRDRLVICLEPDLLTSAQPGLGPSKFGFAMSSMTAEPAMAGGGREIGRTLHLRDYLNLPRPGAEYLATLSARLVTGKGYRYREEDIRYRGRIETQTRGAAAGGSPGPRSLSAEGAALLRRVHAESLRRGIHIAYSMPWYLVEHHCLDDARTGNRVLLDQIRSIMPVIDDAYAGAASEADWFSDSPQHLTAAGAYVRSSSIIPGLEAWLNSLP